MGCASGVSSHGLASRDGGRVIAQRSCGGRYCLMVWLSVVVAVAVIGGLVWLWLGPLAGNDPRTPLDEPDVNFEAFRTGSHREWGP